MKYIFALYFLIASSLAMGQVIIPDRAELAMARASILTDGAGQAILDLKIPGTPGSESRLIAGGSGWFDVPVVGDHFDKVEIVDIDGLVKLGYMGAGMTEPEALAAAQAAYPSYPIVGTFHDTETTGPLKAGWFMPPGKPLEVKSIGGEERLPAGMYLRFHVQKGSAVVDTFRVNIFWGRI